MCLDSTKQSRAPRSDSGDTTERRLTLRLHGFAWDALEEEATRGGLSAEELIAFSVLYYLADVDSGRISRQISRSPYPRPLSEARPGQPVTGQG
jgi:hypothetical protein